MNFQRQSAKVIAFTLSVVLLLLSLSACGSNTDKENSEGDKSAASSTAGASTANADKEKEPVVLTILWGNEGMKGQGIMEDAVAKEIERQTGVKMDIDVANSDKIKVKLASGDLADLMLLNSNYDEQVFKGDLSINMEPLLETNGQKILKSVPERIKIEKYKNKERGKEGVYKLAIRASNPDSTGAIDYFPTVSLFTRWDYYKELGYPEVKSSDDYVKVLADMVKKHPETADGKKVYGLSGWLDWGLWPFFVAPIYESGYGELGDGGYINHLTEDYQIHNYFIDENGPLWTGIEMYYKANKLGLVDTDLFTMKYDAFMAKAKSGQVLTVYGNWQANEGNTAFTGAGQTSSGFEPLPGVFGSTNIYPIVSPGGDGEAMYISTSCKNPDRAVDLLNYTFSYEGSRTLTSGIKGEHWDIVNGKAEPTDAAMNESKSNPDFDRTTGIGLYYGLQGVNSWSIDPNDNSPIALLDNSDKALKLRLTEMDKDYCAHYGNAEFPGQVFDNLVKEGKIIGKPFNALYTSLMNSPSDKLKGASNNAQEYLKKNIAKIVLAKNDAAYQAEKKKAIDDMISMGVDKLYEYQVSELASAKKKVDEALK